MGDFVRLGKDVVSYLFIFLDVKDLVALSSANHWLRAVAKKPHVWRQLVARDFGLTDLNKEDPFTVYREEHGFASWHNYKCDHIGLDCLQYAAQNGFLNDVKVAIRHGVDPAAVNNAAVQHAAADGRTEVVRLLLADKRVDPTVYDNWSIRAASVYGHTEIVKLLLTDKRVDPSAYENSALRNAAQRGHTEIVKLLLADERVDPSAYDSFALREASARGHTEIVELLRAHKKVKL